MKKMQEKYKSIMIKVCFTVLVLIGWEIIARANLFGERSRLVFPTIEEIGRAFVGNFTSGYAGVSFWIYIANSMKLLLTGLLLGVVLAFVFSGLAMVSRIFFEIYNYVVAICDLLPGVALLPVVIVIFGITPGVIVFLVVHAVIWPMSRNILDGFMAVPKIYVESGMNMGLSGISLLLGVYIPAATSYIVSGLKVGWARAWRGLISAEMIFGIARSPGIGLYINQMRTNMKNAEMYATLLVIIMIGLIVQYGILAPIENYTVKRWGMSK
ncbi:MAG: ABC transporter permease [Suilimivivens sp.]